MTDSVNPDNIVKTPEQRGYPDALVHELKERARVDADNHLIPSHIHLSHGVPRQSWFSRVHVCERVIPDQAEWPEPVYICAKRFARKSDLDRHERIHDCNRAFSCDKCPKDFIQRSALVVHNRTHTGEKPHKCRKCSKGFSDSSSLARHRRTHDSDKPFYCPIKDCGKKYTRKNSLDRHHCSYHDPPRLRGGALDVPEAMVDDHGEDEDEDEDNAPTPDPTAPRLLPTQDSAMSPERGTRRSIAEHHWPYAVPASYDGDHSPRASGPRRRHRSDEDFPASVTFAPHGPTGAGPGIPSPAPGSALNVDRGDDLRIHVRGSFPNVNNAASTTISHGMTASADQLGLGNAPQEFPEAYYAALGSSPYAPAPSPGISYPRYALGGQQGDLGSMPFQPALRAHGMIPSPYPDAGYQLQYYPQAAPDNLLVPHMLDHQRPHHGLHNVQSSQQIASAEYTTTDSMDANDPDYLMSQAVHDYMFQFGDKIEEDLDLPSHRAGHNG